MRKRRGQVRSEVVAKAAGVLLSLWLSAPLASMPVEIPPPSYKVGLIDHTGKFAVSPCFDDLGAFGPNGLAPARVGGLWGYIDSTGRLVIPPRFFLAQPFGQDGLALVSTEQRMFFPSVHIDASGSVVDRGPIDHTFAHTLKTDAATSDLPVGLVPVSINHGSETVMADVGHFGPNGLAPAVNVDTRKAGYVNRHLEVVVPFKFDQIGSFTSNDLAWVRTSERYGYINASGTFAIPPDFEIAEDFASDGLARVMQDHKWGFIDARGQFVVFPRYDLIQDFMSSGLAIAGFQDSPACESGVRNSIAQVAPAPIACPLGKGLCPSMIQIPGGEFRMGNFADFEVPRHGVAVKSFLIAKTPVTFAQYDSCVAAGGCKHDQVVADDAGWGRGDRPVINVNYDDAGDYVAWLSKMLNVPFRLPSEAEYEFAARGGTTTAFWWGEQPNNTKAHIDASRTSRVESYPANPFGLFDISGNVWEWTADCWHDSYKGAPSDGSAWTTRCGGAMAVRGGSWHVGNGASAGRELQFLKERTTSLGFRVALQCNSTLCPRMSDDVTPEDAVAKYCCDTVEIVLGKGEESLFWSKPAVEKVVLDGKDLPFGTFAHISLDEQHTFVLQCKGNITTTITSFYYQARRYRLDPRGCGLVETDLDQGTSK